MNKAYRSSISKKVLIPLMVILGGLSFFFIIIGIKTGIKTLWIGILIPGIVIAYLIFLYLKTTYRFTEGNQLKIRAGFSYKIVAIKDISEIKKNKSCSNFPSVYALSEKRLRITCNNRSYFEISPKNQQEFILELQKINPGIKYEN